MHLKPLTNPNPLNKNKTKRLFLTQIPPPHKTTNPHNQNHPQNSTLELTGCKVKGNFGENNAGAFWLETSNMTATGVRACIVCLCVRGVWILY